MQLWAVGVWLWTIYVFDRILRLANIYAVMTEFHDVCGNSRADDIPMQAFTLHSRCTSLERKALLCRTALCAN